MSETRAARSTASGRARRRYRLRRDGEEIDVGSPFVIGRGAECQLLVKGDLVSRRHASLSEQDEGLFIADLGSLNGVFVNQHRIREPTLLAHGDLIGIGLETFEVVDVELARRREKPTIPAPVPFAES
jgi:pSer/pThr/pTyr-binding forkhead associated (FHA) protein